MHNHDYNPYVNEELDRVEHATSEAMRIRDYGSVTDWKEVLNEICTRWNLTDDDDIWRVEKELM